MNASHAFPQRHARAEPPPDVMAKFPAAPSLSAFGAGRRASGDTAARTRKALALGMTAALHVLLITAVLLDWTGAMPNPAPHTLTVSLMPENPLPKVAPPPPMPQMKIDLPPMIAPEVTIEMPPSASAITLAPPPVQQVSAPATATTDSFAAQLMRHLDRMKRYPPEARARREQGTVMLRFTMDRDGNVLDYAIVKSSGHKLLDDETLAMIQRAQPLPRMPADMKESKLQLTVPVEFYVR